MNLDNKDKIEAFLPPIELLRKYEEVEMGGDLIKLIKTEQEHRLNLQRKYCFQYKIGQFFAFVISMYFFYNIFKLILNDKTIHAYILSAIFLLFVVAIYVFSRKENTVQHQSKINYKKQLNNNRRQSDNSNRKSFKK